MSNRNINMAWAGVAAIVMVAPAAWAQTAPKDDKHPSAQQPPARKSTSVRKSVVDLEQMAKERRPGQVMPGDPGPGGTLPNTAAIPATETPAGGATPMPAATPAPAAPVAIAAPAKATVPLPDTAPYNKPVLKPAMDGSPRAAMLEAPPAPPTPPASPAPVQEQAAPGDPNAGANHAQPMPVVAEKAAPTQAAPEAQIDPAADLVERSILASVPMSMNTGAARVKIESVSGETGSIQWRTLGEAWRVPTTGETTEARVEVRAGLDAEVVIVVDDRVQVRVSRLGRAMIERSEESGGATSVCVTVARGAVEIRPVSAAAPSGAGLADMFARVRTPDQAFGLVGPLRIEYDAFTGTRRRVPTP